MFFPSLLLHNLSIFPPPCWGGKSDSALHNSSGAPHFRHACGSTGFLDAHRLKCTRPAHHRRILVNLSMSISLPFFYTFTKDMYIGTLSCPLCLHAQSLARWCLHRQHISLIPTCIISSCFQLSPYFFQVFFSPFLSITCQKKSKNEMYWL